MSLSNSPSITSAPIPAQTDASIGFTQVPNRIIEHSTASLAAKMVYITLLKYSRQGDRAFPSQETLARELNTSTRSIHTYLAELEKHALITIQRRGRTQANLYRLKESVDSDRKYLQVRAAKSAGSDLQNLQPNNTQQEEYESNKTHGPVVISLMTEEITESVAAKLVLQYGPAACRRQLDWLPDRKARDKAAVLVKSIQGQWSPPATLEAKPTTSPRVGDGVVSLAGIMGQLAGQGVPGSEMLAKLAG